MEEEKKETIVIPRVKDFIKKAKESLEKKPYLFYFVLIFFLFAGLLILITYLPMSQLLKVISLIIGSFILEDIHHSLKLLCLKYQN